MHHYLVKIWRPSLAVILFFLSSVVYAEDYPSIPVYSWSSATSSSGQGVCDQIGVIQGTTSTFEYFYRAISSNQGACDEKYISTHSLNQSYFVNISGSCPGGGSWTSGVCVGAPDCSAGETRSTTTGICSTPPKTCGVGEYNSSPSTCTPIPDCNTATTGNYFDVNSGGCVPPQCPETGGVCDVKACEDTTKYYCPPTDSCNGSGSTCSNDPNAPDATKAQRDAQIAADRASADSDAATAAAAKDAAAKAADTKAADAASADAAQKAAETAAKDASATQAARDAAAQDFIDKAREALNKHDSANNAANSANDASAIKQQIDDLNALLHDAATINGNSDTLAKQIHDLLNEINQRLTDAINGFPRGKDTPPDAAHPCPVNENCDGQASNKIYVKDTAPVTAPTDNYDVNLESKRQQYQSLITNAKSEFTSLKPVLSSVGGSLACDGGVMLPVVNVQFQVCLAPYADAFAVMGRAVFFAATAAAIFVILG